MLLYFSRTSGLGGPLPSWLFSMLAEVLLERFQKAPNVCESQRNASLARLEKGTIQHHRGLSVKETGLVSKFESLVPRIEAVDAR
jgi:hypothetical protein